MARKDEMRKRVQPKKRIITIDSGGGRRFAFCACPANSSVHTVDGCCITQGFGQCFSLLDGPVLSWGCWVVAGALLTGGGAGSQTSGWIRLSKPVECSLETGTELNWLRSRPVKFQLVPVPEKPPAG